MRNTARSACAAGAPSCTRSARQLLDRIKATHNCELPPTLATVHKLSYPLQRLRPGLGPTLLGRRLLAGSRRVGAVGVQVIRVDARRPGTLSGAGFLLFLLNRRGQAVRSRRSSLRTLSVAVRVRVRIIRRDGRIGVLVEARRVHTERLRSAEARKGLAYSKEICQRRRRATDGSVVSSS